MRGLGGLDRHRRALLTLTAMMLVAGVAWVAVSAVTASAVPHATKAGASGQGPSGHRVVIPPAPASPSPTPPAPSPAVIAPPVSTSGTPITLPTTAPIAAPAKRPAAPVSPAPVSSPLVAAPESNQAAQVAAALIASVNQQSHGTRSIPVTSDNVSLVARWIMNEGGLPADNPLNTSHGAGSYRHQVTSSGQDTGIPIFPTMSLGVAADAATLLSNPRYARILHVLAGGKASCMAFATAVIRSPWASGHYGHNALGFCVGNMTPRRVKGHRRRRAG